nr:hypothetical protein BdHM001_18410 [Bdellovibrio sp. HM001]
MFDQIGGFVDNATGMNIFGGNSNDKAAAAQAEATGKANQVLNVGLQNQTEYLNPYNQSGLTALQKLSGGNILDPSSLGSDAGYQFRLQQGNTAINNAAAARGMGNSGATLKALTAYGQNLASDEYDKAYNREYNRLSQLTGYGSNAANNLANASGSWATQTSNNHMGLGNAQAAAEMGKANQQAQLANTVVSGLATKFSDHRLKKNIEPIGKKDIDELRKELRAFYYEYKDVLHGDPGVHIGILAQDLEKSKLGKWIVVEDKDGNKMIDLSKVLSLFLATMADAEVA